MSDNKSIQSKGGKARAGSLNADEREQIARKAAQARWTKGLPEAMYVGEIEVGDAKLGCAVLENSERVLTQSDMMRALGRARQAKGRGFYDADVNLPAFLTAKNLKPFVSDDLHVSSSQIKFKFPSGAIAFGYRADLLPKVCEVYLKARDANALVPQQAHIAVQADILMRGLAAVGIVALVDEATGYEKVRKRNALAEILEKFIAKELQPWIKTFPDDYYEELFRLRGLNASDITKRPQYFGHLTNDIIYKRLAPAVLEELKKTVPKDSLGRPKHHLHRRLTPELGHPKLREHMASVLTAMKLSDDYDDFLSKLDRVHPRYNETAQLEFPESR